MTTKPAPNTLKKMGLDSPMALALHLPSRYEDETQLYSIEDSIHLGRFNAIQTQGVVIRNQVLFRPRRQMVVTIEDETATLQLRFLNFYPSQQVEVLETKTLLIDWQGVKGYEPMVRLRTFSRSDFGKTWASHPHLVHKVTAVSGANSYREKVKGTVYSPVALGPDFDFAGNFMPASWWLLERWLL